MILTIKFDQFTWSKKYDNKEVVALVALQNRLRILEDAYEVIGKLRRLYIHETPDGATKTTISLCLEVKKEVAKEKQYVENLLKSMADFIALDEESAVTRPSIAACSGLHSLIDVIDEELGNNKTDYIEFYGFGTYKVPTRFLDTLDFIKD